MREWEYDSGVGVAHVLPFCCTGFFLLPLATDWRPFRFSFHEWILLCSPLKNDSGWSTDSTYMTVEQPPSAVLTCRCNQLLFSFRTHNLRDSRSRYLVLLIATDTEHEGGGGFAHRWPRPPWSDRHTLAPLRATGRAQPAAWNR
ncbi:hypothetical protein BHE74_00012502 [Ensete ventricosum]|nr:hypothetical protein BHE74_00012502 [Ensete ventricosum]